MAKPSLPSGDLSAPRSNNPDLPGLRARKAVLTMLDGVLRRGETLDMAERGAAKALAPADRALARAIASETLRWLVDLDALIDSATRKPLQHEAKARQVLRLMLAQWLRLDTPPHAVIATGLPLLTGGLRRLAHGVFSTLTKRPATLPEAPTLPDAVRMRWGNRAEAIAGALALPPPLDLTVRDWSQTERWTEELGGVSLMPGHIRLPRGEAIEALPGFADGAWWVQDIAASLPARLLGPGESRKALDLCSAPGGKTLQLAAQGWDVTSLDVKPKRLDRVEQNLKRTGLSATLVSADALTWEPTGQFDAILLDAPCTATGTCRRHPDVLHRIGAEHITAMAALQAKLLERAAHWLAPGGTLVYAVCSLEQEEGEAQPSTIGLTTDPITAAELPDGVDPASEGWVRTHPGLLPNTGGMDGFFIVRLKA
ncbi:16S rRNA (cytosine(967)-C(5))-methyltransferase [Alteripontixanthobacter maritimus]|uniref:16S rRNA (Cytosine(967)-C(5))-methyltransferase n=1 Tax=Alteripontixanthobacter maritimus TaxID=2161824 RepID=A0A369Q7C0_9SPHN|nr:transcription antitermination factor NusB [Alteripontixanthobacter maritimus]RDC59056.1 16S rRNA (cytosine(967)-C(5))-methyltransferase [Alteripontixanthobacter maritimus]